MLEIEAPCSIATNFSCSSVEKAFRGKVLEADVVTELLAMVEAVEEATAASYVPRR